MRIIIPMAGIGKRMRPHTLTTPKPLLPIAGKSVVYRLIEEITKVIASRITEIAFVIGDFGNVVESELINIAKQFNTNGKIYYQKEPLGTAHAVYCAAESLRDKVVIAFADTLFKAEFNIDSDSEGIIWVKRVDNPSLYGVVEHDGNQFITGFFEKPGEFISDKAIIGIYYFKNGEVLRNEVKSLIDKNIKENNEYQLTNVLENMKNSGIRFKIAEVTDWLDCGNKNITVKSNSTYLNYLSKKERIGENVKLINTQIIEPVYLGDNVVIFNSVIGPGVSVENNVFIESCVISESILLNHAKLNNAVITNSIIGKFADYQGEIKELSLGDYSIIK